MLWVIGICIIVIIANVSAVSKSALNEKQSLFLADAAFKKLPAIESCAHHVDGVAAAC
jgi:hypothetical protein